MIISDAIDFEFEGHTAVMRVLRNDGYCWGRIVTTSGEQLDVTAFEDYDGYNDDDADCAEHFIEAVTQGGRSMTEPAMSEI